MKKRKKLLPLFLALILAYSAVRMGRTDCGNAGRKKSRKQNLSWIPVCRKPTTRPSLRMRWRDGRKAPPYGQTPPS